MIYLDNAATTNKKPQVVLQAVMEELQSSANPGRSGHKYSLKSADRIYSARESIKRLFNINDETNIILTPNATYGLNIAIKGILNPGDHVITTSMEHNSVLRPLNALSGILVTSVKADTEGFVNPIDVEKSVKPYTKLIVINHSSNVTGSIQDIDAITRIAGKYKIPILIDASQSAGHVEIDVNKLGIDMLAFPGHKGLFGPQGTGGLYIKKGLKLKTIVEGGTGSESKSIVNPVFLPDRFESGTLNVAGFYGLSMGINFVLEEGIKNIADYEHRLMNLIYTDLKNMDNVILYGPSDSKRKTGVLSFNIKNKDCSEVEQILDEKFNIAVRSGFHCAYDAHETIGTEESGTVRASISYFTTQSEVLKFINAVYQISKM